MARPSGFTRKPSELTKYKITKAKQKLILTQNLIAELEAQLKKQEKQERSR